MKIDPCTKKGHRSPEEDQEAAQPSAEFERAWQRAEQEAADFATCTAPERREAIAGWLGRGTGAAYLAVREVAEPMLGDRMLDEDIRKVRELLEDGVLFRA